MSAMSFLKEDIQSILCVGMYANKRLIGFLGFDMVARQRRRWSKSTVRRIRHSSRPDCYSDFIRHACSSLWLYPKKQL